MTNTKVDTADIRIAGVVAAHAAEALHTPCRCSTCNIAANLDRLKTLTARTHTLLARIAQEGY